MIRFFFIRYEIDRDLGFFSRYDTISINIFSLSNDLFLGIYCLTTFFWGEFSVDLFFRHFFDELFPKKGGGSLGPLNYQKCVFFAL